MLVAGDVMLDRYIVGNVQRISPEAPVPVVSAVRDCAFLGGAGHVAASVSALNSDASLFGLIGLDPDGEEVKKLLVTHAVRDSLLSSTLLNTVAKTRLLSTCGHHIARVDRDGDRQQRSALALELSDHILARIACSDAVILSDYNKGTLAEELLTRIIRECRSHGTLCVIDPKRESFAAYRGANIITPNLREAETAIGRAIVGDEGAASAAHELRDALCLDAVLITRGKQGMTLATGAQTLHLRATAYNVAEVAGAGDTVAAVLTTALASGSTIKDAAAASNVAAGIAVSRQGTHVVSGGELKAALRGGNIKVCELEEAVASVQRAKLHGARVVFTNGCFDILHVGHLRCLEEARRLGDMLIVAVNSDSSVRSLKGPGRPINSEVERVALLSGLSCVDLVLLFSQATPEHIVLALNPDVLVKGGDYKPDQIAGASHVLSRGGSVVIIPLTEGRSSTRLISQLQKPAEMSENLTSVE